MKGRNFFEKIKSIPKVYLVIGLFLIVLVSVGVPSLARYKNRVVDTSVTVWDGSIASSYQGGDGSSNNPYVIANASQLAYFSEMLKATNYSNTYFVLSNDILLNDGVFNKTDSGVTYTYNGSTLYVGAYSNLLYNDEGRSSLNDKRLNMIGPFSNFKGHFDGNAYSIKGLYVASNDASELGLFTNLQGEVKDLIVTNAVVYGGAVTGGIASTATNSVIKNTMYDGLVLGKGDVSDKDLVVSLDNVSKEKLGDTKKLSLNLTDKVDGSLGFLKSVKVRGICSSDLSSGNIMINGVNIPECNGGSFEVELDKFVTRSLDIDASGVEFTSLEFTGLEYVVNYNESVTAGIVAKAEGLELTNVVNKGVVNSSSLAAGLVGTVKNNLAINQTYNTGTINGGNLASGLVGVVDRVDGNVSINKSYNSGSVSSSVTSGVVGYINNGAQEVNITESFQVGALCCINTVKDTSVRITKSYRTTATAALASGVTSGSFSRASVSNILRYVGFNEFVSAKDLESNPSNVWIKEGVTLPILFIDDALDSTVSINVSDRSWNNFSPDLDSYYYTKPLTFSIDLGNEGVEAYYYLSDKSLTKEELEAVSDWKLFEGVTTIDTEGSYVVNAKIVDFDGNNKYYNTDLLVYDKTPPKVEASYEGNTWNSLKSDSLKTIYIDGETTFSVIYSDEVSKVKETSYYIANKVLTDSELNEIGAEEWVSFTDKVIVPKNKLQVVYIRAIDNASNVTYISSDYIAYGGYSQDKMFIGENIVEDSEKKVVSDNSQVAFTYLYQDEGEYLDSYSHNLVINKELPSNVKITLIDKKSNKVYSYITDSKLEYQDNSSCVDSTNCSKITNISFDKFIEVGSLDKKFVEVATQGIDEEFKVILEFEKASISESLEGVSVGIKVLDANKNIVRSTLKDTIRLFTVSTNNKVDLSVSSSYNSSINYSSDATYEIPILSTIKGQDNILNTSILNKSKGLLVKMVDSEDRVIAKKYLKNMEFLVGDVRYFPDQDGIVRIPLNTLDDVNTSLKIVTSKDGAKLNGDVRVLIYSYLARDGIYGKKLSNNFVSIPVVYQNDYDKSQYGFKVTGLDSKVITKDSPSSNVRFNIYQTGNFTNGSVRVSLYKKTNLSAYDQKYTLINLGSYTDTTLSKVSDSIYVAIENSSLENTQFNLNLLSGLMDSGGYQLMFELYEGDMKVGEVAWKFIVK